MVNNDVLVSVIVPIYNGNSYILDAILRFERQTCQDFEVIFIDDGSSDGSLLSLEELLKTSDQYTIIQQNNSGVSSARNKGIDAARGKYLMFMDIDDRVDDDYIDKYMNDVLTISPNLEVAFHGVRYINDDGSLWRETFSFDDSYNHINIQEILCRYFNDEFGAYSFQLILKKSFVRKHGIYFNEQISFLEDTLFLFNILMVCDKIHFFPETKYNYVNNSESVTHNYNERHIKSFEVVSTVIGSFILSQYPQIKGAYCRWKFNRYFVFVWDFSKKNTINSKKIFHLENEAVRSLKCVSKKDYLIKYWIMKLHISQILVKIRKNKNE